MSNGKIFISYRRADSAYAAGRLYDRLSARFGEKQVFMDVEHLDPGVNFVEAINKAVSECDVLIALIGPQWLNAQDENGKRRLDNPLDFVRLEIAAALERNIRVIPILLQGAHPPQKDQLPSNLQSLAQLNAFEIRHERFNADADRLGRAIEAYRVEDAERREREAVEKTTREKAEREQRARELAQQETQMASYLEKANAAMVQKDWQTAQDNYRQILHLKPDYIEVQNGLKIASQNLELARWYGQAILHQDEGRLESALRILQRIQGRDAGYRDVPALTTAIEELIAEHNKKTAETDSIDPPSWKQRFLERISTLPRGLGYLGSGVGLILMLVLVFWGGNELFGWLSGVQTPTSVVNTPFTAQPTETNTSRPSTPTPNLAPEDLPQFIIDDFGISMALIPAGPFEMGSEDGDDDEKPVHTVSLDDFYMDQYETTNENYAKCVDAGVCEPPSNSSSETRINYYGIRTGANYPVIYVNWGDAQTYCQWRGARLPTEAEWEKASRGGLEGALYPWGDSSPFCKMDAGNGAMFDDDADCDDTDTVKVGSYEANGYGLYDMAGNVWEWTQSIYQEYPYDPEDGRENLESSGARVVRGGSWLMHEDVLRTSNRGQSEPSSANNNLGFRCARDAAP